MYFPAHAIRSPKKVGRPIDALATLRRIALTLPAACHSHRPEPARNLQADHRDVESDDGAAEEAVLRFALEGSAEVQARSGALTEAWVVQEAQVLKSVGSRGGESDELKQLVEVCASLAARDPWSVRAIEHRCSQVIQINQ